MPKRTESRVLKRYLYKHIHSSTIHSGQKMEAIKCPSADEWVSEMLSIPTKEYFSASKRKEILKYAIIHVNFKDIVIV